MWSVIRCAAAAGLLVVAFYSASIQLTTKNLGRRLRAAQGGDAHGRMLQTACDISGAYAHGNEAGYSIVQTGGAFTVSWPNDAASFNGQVNDDCTGTLTFGTEDVGFEFTPSTFMLDMDNGVSFHQVVAAPEPTPEPTALVIEIPTPAPPALTPEPTAATPTPTVAPGNVVVVETPAPTAAATPMPTAANTPVPTAGATPTPTVAACATSDIAGHYIPEGTEDDYTLVQSGSTLTLSIGAAAYDGTFNSDCTGTVTFAADAVENFVYQSGSGNLEFTLQNGGVINFVLQDGDPPVTVVDTPMPTMDSSTPMPTMMDTPMPTMDSPGPAPVTSMPTPPPTDTPEPTKAPRVRQVMIKMKDESMCLDAKERNTKNGKMHMWPCQADNKNQHWEYTKATGQLKLHDGLCLEFKAVEDKGKVVTFPCKEGKNGQAWRYKKGKFRAVPNNDEVEGNFCLDAVKGADAGGKVVLMKCKKARTSQKWKLNKRVFDYKEDDEEE